MNTRMIHITAVFGIASVLCADANGSGEPEYVSGFILNEDATVTESDRLYERAVQAREENNLSEAERLLREALAACAAEHGGVGVECVPILGTLNSVVGGQGRGEDAIAISLRIVEIVEHADAPPVLRGKAYEAAAHDLNNAERYDEARVYAEKGLNVLDPVLGSGDPFLATAHNNAGISVYRSDPELGLAHFERAEAIWREAGAAWELDVAKALNNSAAALAMLGRHDDALAALGKALAIRERLLPVNHAAIGSTRQNMELLRKQERGEGSP